MGLNDRDYMRNSSADEEAVEAYETAARAREYGNFAARRNRGVLKAGLAVGVAAALVLLYRIAAALVRQ